MKAKAKAIEECATLFEIEFTAEEIDKAFEEVYDEISKVSSIPGFRTGKAPKELVRKHYAGNAKEEVLKRLIPQAYRMALEQHKISPIGLPEISDVALEEGKNLSFKARIDTAPKFKLKDYKGIRIEKKAVAVKDEDVARMLDNLRELNSRYTAVEGRPVRMGDYVVSDLECFIDGKPAHKRRENLWIYLDKDALMPELHERMAGMNPGEERDIELTIPEKYPDKAMAGKAARYHVKAKEIKERVLPNLDDEFAKDLGKADLEELKNQVREELAARMKASVELEMESQLLGKIAAENVFAVPSRVVARQLSYMVEDAKENLMRKGFKKEDLDKKDKEFAEKLKDDAARRVRLLFILNDIARLEKIEATEEDVKEAYRLIALQTGKTQDEVKAHYEKEDLVEDLKEKLKEEKTIRFLLDNADITEKA